MLLKRFVIVCFIKIIYHWGKNIFWSDYCIKTIDKTVYSFEQAYVVVREFCVLPVSAHVWHRELWPADKLTAGRFLGNHCSAYADWLKLFEGCPKKCRKCTVALQKYVGQNKELWKACYSESLPIKPFIPIRLASY